MCSRDVVSHNVRVCVCPTGFSGLFANEQEKCRRVLTYFYVCILNYYIVNSTKKFFFNTYLICELIVTLLIMPQFCGNTLTNLCFELCKCFKCFDYSLCSSGFLSAILKVTYLFYEAFTVKLGHVSYKQQPFYKNF